MTLIGLFSEPEGHEAPETENELGVRQYQDEYKATEIASLSETSLRKARPSGVLANSIALYVINFAKLLI